MILNHLFYQNPTTFGDCILVLEKSHQFGRFYRDFSKQNRSANPDFDNMDKT